MMDIFKLKKLVYLQAAFCSEQQVHEVRLLRSLRKISLHPRYQYSGER